MVKIKELFSSLIGLKLIMALTGILLSFFLLMHMSGNLLVLFSPEAFNFYSYRLTSNKTFLYVAEVGLAAIFLLHVFVAIKLTRLNRQAKPQSYVYKKSTGRSRRSWMSSNMMMTGSLIFLFLIFHIRNFKFGEVRTTVQNGIEMRDLAFNVINDFSNPSYVVIYVLAMFILILHLLHGVRSFFASTSLETQKTASFNYWVSRAFVFVVGVGFILIPLWIYFVGV